MVIQNIRIHDLGAIDTVEYKFGKELNVIKHCYAEEISFAIRAILNHKNVPLPVRRGRGIAEIEARVLVSGTPFQLVISKDETQKEPCLCAYNEHGVDATREYLGLIAHCHEHDDCDRFNGATKATHPRILRYLDEDDCDPSELATRTEQRSETKTFRAYLNAFLKSFEPEKIRAGKHYELVADAHGTYGIKYKSDDGKPVCLSESEQTLFRYLCFLRTAEFWNGFELIRNMHSVKKPLLVENFLERLDESIDVKELLRRTAQLNRQLIIFST